MAFGFLSWVFFGQSNAAIAIQQNSESTIRSEGDVAHRADAAREVFGLDGSGVKIGVLSDGVSFLESLQTAGELPDVHVIDEGRGSEGTAMLEIIHDLAPGAELYFASGYESPQSMVENIGLLRNEGCRIIVDDISYKSAPVFQDGPIAQAVSEAVTDGVFYFTSAGNLGGMSHSQTPIWEGDFVASDFDISSMENPSKISIPEDVVIHSFEDSTVGKQVIGNQMLGSSGRVTLKWSDPMGRSDNDYGICAVSEDLKEIHRCSTRSEGGKVDPYAELSFVFSGDRLIIYKAADAEDRYLRIDTHKSQAPLQISTEGQIFGHAAVEGAFAVAAVDVAFASGRPFVHLDAESVETFSSRGPRRVFYHADGTPIAGGFLSTSGEERQKPDFAAADRVSTATPRYESFKGTSAAAPHAAAIAALVLQANPSLSPSALREVLTSTAIDIEASGFDSGSGAGLLNAFAAVKRARELNTAEEALLTIPPRLVAQVREACGAEVRSLLGETSVGESPQGLLLLELAIRLERVRIHHASGHGDAGRLMESFHESADTLGMECLARLAEEILSRGVH